MRREVDAEAGSQFRDPGELVGNGWHGRATEALQPSLEIEQGAVALEHRRRGQNQIRPPDREPLEHRDRDHGVCPFGERSHARRGGSVIPDDEEQADLAWIRLVCVCGGRPGHRHATSVRRRGQMERSAAGLVLEAERMRRLRDSCPAAAARTRPDEDRPLGRAEPLAESASGLGEVVERVARGARR